MKSVVAEMAADNPGTPISVALRRAARLSARSALQTISSELSAADKLTKDRLLGTGDRYDMAAAIAREMQRVSGATPDTMLVANGEPTSTKFFDALALSPIAASEGLSHPARGRGLGPERNECGDGRVRALDRDRRRWARDRLGERAQRSGRHTLVGSRPLRDGNQIASNAIAREHAHG